MTIGIDASRAFLKQRTGIEEYAYQVIQHVRGELGESRVVLYVRRGQNIGFHLPKNWEVRVIRWPRFWTQCGLALEMFMHPVDVVFVPAHTVPWVHSKKTVVTVHGLEYEMFPEAYSRWERLYMRWSIRFSCRWATKIIAVSENTKRDLMRLYRVSEEKISVIYEGIARISNFEFRISHKENTKYEILNTKYLLFIGRIETRKNVQRVLEAFEILKTKYGVSHTLVLAGKPGYGYETIKQKAVSSKQKGEIIELGYITEEEKWELLKGANVFLFPTLYEGFGLPILEAQSVGVPVVTSNTSSLPEVAGNSALLVDPFKPEEIAEATHMLITDTKKREELVALGYENVKRFSWEKCAREVAQILYG